MTRSRDPNSVRPGLLLVTALVGAAALATVYGVTRSLVEPATFGDIGRTTEDARGGRRLVLGRDDSSERSSSFAYRGEAGGDDHARAQWAEYSSELQAQNDERSHQFDGSDPQWMAYHSSFPAETLVPFRPTEQTGTIADASGLELGAGESCDVRVLPVNTGSFNCLIRVSCGGQVIYPNRAETAGYVRCDTDGVQPLRALDDAETGRDGDPAVSFDLENRRVVVWEGPEASPTYRVAIDLPRS